MYCCHCGAELIDGDAFCGSCGKPTGFAGMPDESPHASAGVFRPRKKLVKVFAGTIVAVIFVAVAAVGALASGVFSDGYKTADDLVADLEKSSNGFWDDLTSDATIDCVEHVFACVHSDLLDPILAADGFTRDLYIEEILYYYSEEELAEARGHLLLVDISVDLEAGAFLDEEEMSDINDSIRNMGVGLRVADGRKILAEVTMTVTDDFPDGSAMKGEMEADGGELQGVALVQIDDRWYLWVDEAYCLSETMSLESL